ncbi:PREDICTED: neuronal acetylcholine receptor subunit alpha-10-like [Branchiostoma belcheri]|uniref:Neuronal acetylcholine receptor subunit alpha-10-like n=1 Tax=Branchiostoma belcheri TaxID=7741 RepID=A0A6P5A0E3_BRABE|nr:PREDICTED: neuronal acetylcholine receptor subunit alpha-10-like [Branchiostoma belcheri]
MPAMPPRKTDALVLLVSALLSTGSCGQILEESTFSAALPEGYNRHERPTNANRTLPSDASESSPTLLNGTLPTNNSEPPPTVVWLDFAIREVDELDAKSQTLTILVDLQLRWIDDRLMTSGPGKSTRILPKNLLWSPDLYLLNTNDGKDWSGRLEVCNHVRLHGNGTVVCRGQTILISGCQVDVTAFPFDSQSCPLRFGSWLYGWDELRWENLSFTAEMHKEDDWDLIGFPVRSERMTHIGWREPHSELTVFLLIRRKPFFKVVELMLPCVLLQVLTFLGMLLPSAIPVRVQYNVTIFLVLILYLYSVESELPGNTATVPLIDIWFHNTMGLVGFSILFIVLVLKVHHKPLSDPVPAVVRRLLLRKPAAAPQEQDGTGAATHAQDNGSLTTPIPRVKVYRSPVLIRRDAHARSLHDVSEEPPCPVHVTTAKDVTGTAQYFEKFDELSDKFNDILQQLDPGPEEPEPPEWTTVAMVMDRIFVILWLIGALTSDVIILVFFRHDIEAEEERKALAFLD